LEVANYVEGMEEFLKAESENISKIPYKRVLAVGDIHGHFAEFMTLLKKLDVSSDDLLIFLGDLIQGGTENLKMIRWAMAESKKSNVIVLMGNSENDFWQKPRGNLASELKNASESEQQQVISFLQNLPTHYYLNEIFFFCHAGIDPQKSLLKQPKSKLLNNRPKNFAEEYLGKTLIVVGHTRVQKINAAYTIPIKLQGKNILLLDTGIKKGGRISCVDVLSGQYWQSEE
jgi:serine/threonine protein phosphatase 1